MAKMYDKFDDNFPDYLCRWTVDKCVEELFDIVCEGDIVETNTKGYLAHQTVYLDKNKNIICRLTCLGADPPTGSRYLGAITEKRLHTVRIIMVL